MKINKFWQYVGILVSLSIINILYILNINSLYIRDFFVFLFALIIPGYLIVDIFLSQKMYIAEKFSYIIGFSIAFLILLGLLLNTILPIFNLGSPLDIKYILSGFNISIFLLSVCAWLKSKNTYFILDFKITGSNVLAVILTVVTMILCVCGAIYLNNTGNNSIALIALASILVSLAHLVFNKHVSDKTIVISLFLISIAVLFTQSLRSWHIFGWDINPEFKYFQLVNYYSLWQHNITSDSYNSCLSITILPTILSKMLTVGDEYIFKMVMQVFFGLLPVIIFAINKNFFSRKLSLLISFYFLAQPIFIHPMTGIIRQEIGFVFFGLMLLVIFSKILTITKKRLLFIIFGALLVMTHYSTTYITLIILYLAFTTLWFGSFIKRVFRVESIFTLKSDLSFIKYNGTLILLLTLFAYFWYGVYTGTARNIDYVFSNTLESLQGKFNSELKTGDTTHYLSLTNNKKLTETQEFEKYVSEIGDSSNVPESSLYKNANNDIYKLEVKNKEYNASLFSPWVTALLLSIIGVIKVITKIFIIPGLIFLYLKKRNEVGIDFFTLILVSNMILIIMSTVPFISASYNLDRLFFQVMIVSSSVIVFGLYEIFRITLKKYTVILTMLVVSTYFLINYHLDSIMVGGPPFVNLNNKGDDFDKFYIHDSDLSTVKWLSENYSSERVVYADTVSALKLASFTNILKVNNNVYPTTISKGDFVYSSYMNIKENRTEGRHLGLSVSYTYPLNFLNDNKDLLYNTGTSRVYK